MFEGECQYCHERVSLPVHTSGCESCKKKIEEISNLPNGPYHCQYTSGHWGIFFKTDDYFLAFGDDIPVSFGDMSRFLQFKFIQDPE